MRPDLDQVLERWRTALGAELPAVVRLRHVLHADPGARGWALWKVIVRVAPVEMNRKSGPGQRSDCGLPGARLAGQPRHLTLGGRGSWPQTEPGLRIGGERSSPSRPHDQLADHSTRIRTSSGGWPGDPRP